MLPKWIRRRHTSPGGEAPLGAEAPPEAKASRVHSAVAVYIEGRAVWTPRDYAALAREGFQKNAIVHRAVRLVAVQPARLRSLAEVDVSIRTKLIEAKRDQAVSELIERARQSTVVKIDETALEQVEPPPSAPNAPRTP